MNRITPSPCPKCGALHNASTASDGSDATPEENDLTVCITCGSINAFDKNLELVAMTTEQLIKTYDDETIATAQRLSNSVVQMQFMSRLMDMFPNLTSIQVETEEDE